MAHVRECAELLTLCVTANMFIFGTRARDVPAMRHAVQLEQVQLDQRLADVIKVKSCVQCGSV